MVPFLACTSLKNFIHTTDNEVDIILLYCLIMCSETVSSNLKTVNIYEILVHMISKLETGRFSTPFIV